MFSVATIRKDLKDIRYYYSRKEIFDKAEYCVGKNEMLKKIDIYNKAVCLASPQLYDLYVSLYLHNNTQESLSEILGYSFEYISRLNTKLVKFLQKNIIDKEENENAW